MRTCNGFTCRLLDRVSFGFRKNIYTDGVKFCKTCSTFMRIDGYRCPCCKSNVRSKSHVKRWKINQQLEKDCFFPINFLQDFQYHNMVSKNHLTC